MAIGNTRWVRGTVLGFVWLGLALPAGAQSQRIPLPVVVYDYADVAPAVLDGAQRVVSKAFAEIGVDMRWMDEAQFTRELPDNPAERRAFVTSVIVVKVMSPAMDRALRLPKNALGTATAGTRYAWISFARVKQAARLVAADLSDVLGYVIAHEIGHLLLPVNSHSVGGLMQEHVDGQVIAHNRLSFREHHGKLIRAALAARAASASR